MKIKNQLGIINRILLSGRVLIISDNGLCIGENYYMYPNPSESLIFKTGLFIDSILWGEKKFRFLRSNELRDTFKNIDKYRIDYWKPIYIESFDKLINISREFEKFITTYSAYIRESDKNNWIERLHEAKELLGMKEEFIQINLNINIIESSLVDFLSSPEEFVGRKNNKFVEDQLDENLQLFDEIEEHPLTDSQRGACVYDEDNVLVIAGAGTGKTSTIRAKAAYLVKNGFAKPEEILILAYGSEARKELEKRVSNIHYLKDLSVRTFHSLGKEIISQYENRATNVSVLASDSTQYIKFIDKKIESLVAEPSTENILLKYFSEYLYPKPSDLDFKTHGGYLQHVKDNEIRDLAGNLVKSYEELKISNYFFKHGIKFQYEPEYPHPVSKPGRNVYRPDYYLPELNVYLEHFGIDEKGNTRLGINSIKYNDDKDWKISIHKEFSTNLIQTFSYQSKYGLENAVERELAKYCLENELKFEEYLKPVGVVKIFSALKELGTYKTFSKLISNFLTLFKSSPYDLDSLPVTDITVYGKARTKLFHHIFKKIYGEYSSILELNNTMDFADMIRESIKIVNQNDFHVKTKNKFKFKYIMVDEFQDISPLRSKLIESLKVVGQRCAFFCVGDDWQAIYRFTGSDVSLTTNYEDYFGKTYPVYLDKTFRFNNRIEEVASAFVQVNDNQLKKQLVTLNVSDRTEVHVTPGIKEDVFIDILNRINNEAKSGSSVLVLSRFKESLRKVKYVAERYDKLRIKYMSAHASKGKQADYVIILDVIDGKYGFPSKVMTDPLLESLLPRLEDFIFAEERRLFYVALSRSKTSVFIHTELGKESTLIKELKKNGLDVDFETSELSDLVIENALCPECSEGIFVPKKGKFGLFYSCSLGINYCNTTAKVCPTCQYAPLINNGLNHVCANANCDFKAETCPECKTGMLLVRENNRTGVGFIGCSYFKGNEPGSCKFSRRVSNQQKVI